MLYYYRLSLPLISSCCHLSNSRRTTDFLLNSVRCYTSRTATGALVGAFPGFGLRAADVPPMPANLPMPMRFARLLPTASTAPRGASSDGVCMAVSCTRKSLIMVPFQTPAVPLDTSSSLVNTKPQTSDSYHPSDKGDHSKRWTLIVDGSMPRTVAVRMAVRIVDVSCDVST
jgi:hypothetical protein